MDIVAIVVLFLTHIEWSHGNAYSFLYVQITDQNFNTDLEDDRFTPVKPINPSFRKKQVFVFYMGLWCSG